MWELFWGNIKEEMELIGDTPILSSVAFVVAITLAWMALKWRYGKTIELLKQHISFLKDRLEPATSEKPKQKIILPPRATKIQNSKREGLGDVLEFDEILWGVAAG